MIVLVLLQGQLREEKNRSRELQRKLEAIEASTAKLEEQLENNKRAADARVATLEVRHFCVNAVRGI